QIEETDENASEKLWIDLSERVYVLRDTPIVVDEAITSLVERAKIFKPSDEKVVKKVLYHNLVGVIIYARDDNWNSGIYIAKRDDQHFQQVESRLLSQCRCSQADS